eukprot:5383385-Pyramimonas_sp.AAC.1
MRHEPPNTALRGPIGSSTESPSGTARMRHPPPSAALRGPIVSATEGPSGMPACVIHHSALRFVAP